MRPHLTPTAVHWSADTSHMITRAVIAMFASPRGIATGVQDSLGAEEIARICIDCKADVIVVEEESILKKVLLVQHKLPELRCLVQWQGEPPVSDQRRLARSHQKRILSWTGLLELGKGSPVGRDPLQERLRGVAINQCCCLAYTSGSKGVMVSHDNLTWSARMVLGVVRAPGFNRTPSPGEEVSRSYPSLPSCCRCCSPCCPSTTSPPSWWTCTTPSVWSAPPSSLGLTSSTTEVAS